MDIHLIFSPFRFVCPFSAAGKLTDVGEMNGRCSLFALCQRPGRIK